MLDFSSLQEVVVRQFTDGPAGSDWTRLRQGGPSVADDAGDMITPAPEEVPFRAFINEGSAKTTLKQPRGQGDTQDGTLTLYVCQTQKVNGVDEGIDFDPADPEAHLRADTLRRESTGDLWEIQTATLWEAGGFWVLTARLVIGG